MRELVLVEALHQFEYFDGSAQRQVGEHGRHVAVDGDAGDDGDDYDDGATDVCKRMRAASTVEPALYDKYTR